MKTQFLIGTLFSVALASASFAQTPCFAEYDGPTFADGTSMGGPNLITAIKFVAPSNLTVASIEVFTGEAGGTNTLGIWSHDAGNNRPAADLGTGSWSMSNTNSWQGASLPSPLGLTAGSVYWLAWGPVSGSQSSIQVGTSMGQEYRGSFDGGATWNGPFQSTLQWKYRLHCESDLGTALCFGDGTSGGCFCGNTGGLGEGCQNSSGAGATLTAGGSSSVAADNLTFSLAQGPAGVPGILFAGDQLLSATAFGDGLRCAGGQITRFHVQILSNAGAASWGPGLGAQGAWSTGDTRIFQGWFRDTTGPCAGFFNTSHAIALTFTP